MVLFPDCLFHLLPAFSGRELFQFLLMNQVVFFVRQFVCQLLMPAVGQSPLIQLLVLLRCDGAGQFLCQQASDIYTFLYVHGSVFTVFMGITTGSGKWGSHCSIIFSF